MKAALLDILVCPECQKSLELRAEVRRGLEVLEGALRCPGCARDYPNVAGVPRFVVGGAYASSFGKQWHWFRKVQIDSISGTDESERMLAATTGWSDEDYRGQLVLDAGVGAGRFAEIVARKGGDVVGVDLSRAVDAAYENIGRRPNVHLVQADIFAMPFRDGTFDMAYSVGVLHHTPDPAGAFARVAAAVRQGGALAVYLYARYGPSHRFSDMIRVLTTRLPLPVLRALSALAVPAYHLYRIPVLGGALGVVCPISRPRDWRWRWLDTFAWDSPRYQWKLLYPEVVRWFRANGFRDVELLDGPIRVRGVKTGDPA
jgi:SAM-dependent methyltransferase